MKTMSVTKKWISVLLCVALLFSFASLFAVSTVAEAGNYTWRVRVVVDDNFDNLSEEKKPSNFSLKGGTENGTIEDLKIDQKKIAVGAFTSQKDGTNVYLTNLLNDSEVNTSETVTTYTTNYFPTQFTMNVWKEGHAGFGNAELTVYLELKDSSGNWHELCSNHQKKVGFWGTITWEASVPANLMPEARTVEFTKKPATSITVPRTDEPMVTSDYEAKVYDQYGIVWYDSPTVSFTDFHEGVSAGGGAIAITSDANSEDGSNTSLVLRATYLTLTKSINITLTNASYTYKFEDVNGGTISSGTLKYGQSIPKPANPTKQSDETNHYVFENWNSPVGLIKRDVVFKPVFKTVKHSYDNYISDNNATCTKDGTKTATCTCGYTNTLTDTGSALGHTYTSAVTTAPTCTEKGVTTYTCIRGDHSYTEPIEAEGHNYVATTVAPTCTEDGYTLHTCSKCSDHYSSDTVEPLGHAWNDGVITTEPTCLEAGEKKFTCSRCEAERFEDVEPLGHAFGSWTIESYATCTQDGSRFSTCTRCKQKVTEVLAAPGHTWTDWEKETPETCETVGELARFCTTCAAIETEEIPALGHNFDKDNPTIEQPEDGKEGRIYYTCLNGCGQCAYYTIDASGNKEVGEVVSQTDIQSSENDIVPTASFNTYIRSQIGYSYADRGASLRIDREGDADKQPLRFTASMKLPEGVTIKDFGFISANSSKVATNPARFVMTNTREVATTSVKDGNYSLFRTDDGDVYTFNVVYKVQKENWGVTYFVKPYIVYDYMGVEFTVYDQSFSDRSVRGVAQSALDSKKESRFVENYIRDKIFA